MPARSAPTSPPGSAAGAGPGAEAPPKTRPAAKAERSEELRFKVTADFRQRFKQTAKEAGIKKSVLLERLLAAWHERHPLGDRTARPASGNAAPARPARQAGPPGEAKRTTRAKAKPGRS
jgi:hypothetical protein